MKSRSGLALPISPPALDQPSVICAHDTNDLMERRMAGNLHVRNLDDDLIAPLKRRTVRHGRSTEADHCEILRAILVGEVGPSFDTSAAELRKLTSRRKPTPSEVLLREGRKER